MLLLLGRFNQRNAHTRSPSFQERYPVTALPLRVQLSTAPPLQDPSWKLLKTFYSFVIFLNSYFIGFYITLLLTCLNNQLASTPPKSTRCADTFGGSTLQALNCHQPRHLPCSFALHLCPLGIATQKIPQAQSQSCKTCSVQFLLAGALLQKTRELINKGIIKK